MAYPYNPPSNGYQPAGEISQMERDQPVITVTPANQPPQQQSPSQVIAPYVQQPAQVQAPAPQAAANAAQAPQKQTASDSSKYSDIARMFTGMQNGSSSQIANQAPSQSSVTPVIYGQSGQEGAQGIVGIIGSFYGMGGKPGGGGK